jgi:hypothetical protein
VDYEEQYIMNNKLYHMTWVSAHNMINESSGIDMIYTAKGGNLGKALNERDKQSDVMQLRS